MRLTLEIHPTAAREAAAAYRWYADRSSMAAQAFLRELDAAIERIVDAPELHPGYLHGTRRYLLRRFPYLLVYSHNASVVKVVAVAHGRRRPGYWKSRMPR